MRKTFALLLCLCLVTPAVAFGERLTVTVNETFVCDAELPNPIQESMPEFTGEMVLINKDQAISLLMPNGTPIEELEGGDITVGTGDGEQEYMLLQTKAGRVYYCSAFMSQYLMDLVPERNGANNAQYYPTDLELNFMPLSEAREKALGLMETLGLEMSANVEIFTLEKESFGKMQDVLQESDWLGHVSRKQALRYLEPFDEAHEGYFVLMTPKFDGHDYILWENRWKACVFITRQGFEFVETGFNMRKTGETESKLLISAQEALKIAATGNFFYPEDKICTIERISLQYLYRDDKKTLSPYWIFDYCTGGPGEMVNANLDNEARMQGIGVNAHTGKLMDQTIY